MSNQHQYNDVEKKLLKAVTDTGLPVFITGKVGTGKITLADFLVETGNYTLVEDMYENFEQFYETFTREERTQALRNKVFVLVGDSRREDFEKFVGDHISIKTILSTNGELFFQISPAVNKHLLKRLTLSRKKLFHVEDGWKANSRITVNFDLGVHHKDIEITELELTGREGLIQFNRLVDSVVNLSDLMKESGANKELKQIYCVALYLPHEDHDQVSLSKVRSVTSEFNTYGIAVAIFLEEEPNEEEYNINRQSSSKEVNLQELISESEVPIIVESHRYDQACDVAHTLSHTLGYTDMTKINEDIRKSKENNGYDGVGLFNGQLVALRNDDDSLKQNLRPLILISIIDYVEETNSYVLDVTLYKHEAVNEYPKELDSLLETQSVLLVGNTLFLND